MRKTTINKLRLFLLVLTFFLTAPAWGQQVKILPYFSLYGTPLYPQGFKNFSYVNPQAPKGGKIIMPAYGGFDNFNPYIFKGIAAPEVAALLNESLAVVPSDDFATAYPLIAKQFEIPDDHSFIGFILDPRARFHDGSPITAEDVLFSFNSLVEKGAPLYKVYYSDVDRVEIINDHKLRFYFKPDSNNKELPLILSQLPVFSKAYWQDRDFSKPVLEPQLGNGPYKIAKFSPSKHVVLDRVKDYWAQELPSRRGFFNFDQIRYDYYQDTTVTLQALFAGNIDLRQEYIAKIWVTAYDNDLVKNGTIKKEELAHNNTATLQNFAFNLRRTKFQDQRVRQAIGMAFNFDWVNEKLFYNQYRRLNSYFSNSIMEATGRPQGKEYQILNRFRKQLPPEVFGDLPMLPEHKTPEQTRENLRRAVKLLQEAGYEFKDGKMTNLQTGEPLEFEVLSNTANGSSFTRVMLPFIENLKKIGIKAVFRNIETNIFKNRMDNFDFDMLILSYPMSQMPGNEQKEMWGSDSANIKGSFNLIGIQNPVVDQLINEMIQAQTRDDYIAHVRALDRVLRHNHYMIMQWYSAYDRVAYRDNLAHPITDSKPGLQPFTWWDASKGEKKQ